MKCKDCEACKIGWFESKPNEYVCIGAKEPFVISDINVECTEYPEYRNKRTNSEIKKLRLDGEYYASYVGDDGIYSPMVIGNSVYYQCIVSKELFIEAYNKWIKNDSASKYDSLFCGKYDTDCWCDD